jgi:uncharacterized protein YciI
MATWIRTIVLTAAEAECEAAVSEHRAHLAVLHAAGRLRVAGEMGNGAGFVDVFEAKDLREAEATAAESPLVSLGLGAWTLRPWRDLTF